MTGNSLLQRATRFTLFGAVLALGCNSKSTSPPGPPSDIVAASATNITGLVSQAVVTKPSVKVTDQNGTGISGVAVTFAVTGGGGGITGANKTTNGSGIATVGSWTLGPNPGANTLTASATGLNGSPVQFTATSSASNFTIQLVYLSTPTATQKAAFDAAAQHWSRIVVGDIPDVQVNFPANDCNVGEPAINQTVDDVLIYVLVAPIDGVGGILGQAGPCRVRLSDDLPATGVMHFDTADLANLETQGTLNDVILHEMGHVLGFGSIWNDATHSLVVGLAAQCNPPPPAASCDPHFVGANATSAFNTLNGGNAYVLGAKVPVEATGGVGTQDSHWRESVFDTELMTGFISAPGNPLSATTIASLQDLGYTVDMSQADAYTIPAPPALAAAARVRSVHLVDDVLRLPVRFVDDRVPVKGGIQGH
jgi:leishmanolysin